MFVLRIMEDNPIVLETEATKTAHSLVTIMNRKQGVTVLYPSLAIPVQKPWRWRLGRFGPKRAFFGAMEVPKWVLLGCALAV